MSSEMNIKIDGKTGENYMKQNFICFGYKEMTYNEFLENPNIKGLYFIDVREIKEYQKQDVDFLLINQEGKICRFELKTDTRMAGTGNIYLEDKIERELNVFTDGWYHLCQADILSFLDGNNDKYYYYCFNWKKLKQFVIDNNYISERDENKYDGGWIHGYKIPLKDIINNADITVFKGVLNFSKNGGYKNGN